MKNSSFELALNKLLILYIIDNFNHKLKENDLSYFVLNIELFNYFYFKQYLKNWNPMAWFSLTVIKNTICQMMVKKL